MLHTETSTSVCEPLYHKLLLHPGSSVDTNTTKEKKKYIKIHRHKAGNHAHATQRHTQGQICTKGSVYTTKQEESDSEPECIIADKDKVFHEQGDKVHIKLALALSIAALQQKWMPCISERFNYTHIISFNS